MIVLVALWMSFLAGCSNQVSPTTQVSPITTKALSPLVGKWTGEAKLATGNDLTKIANALSGNEMTGASRLTLNADGTGFMKVAKRPERPITWKQDGQKVILAETGNAKHNDTTGETSESMQSYVGTLSDDGTALTIDMGKVKVKLAKLAS